MSELGVIIPLSWHVQECGWHRLNCNEGWAPLVIENVTLRSKYCTKRMKKISSSARIKVSHKLRPLMVSAPFPDLNDAWSRSLMNIYCKKWIFGRIIEEDITCHFLAGKDYGNVPLAFWAPFTYRNGKICYWNFTFFLEIQPFGF
jgi:hypothetical protein